jgi:hypothetical protein
MTETIPAWRDYIVRGHGFFRARVPAQVLDGDMSSVIGEATVEITAEAGVEDGVTLAFDVPHPVDRYDAIAFGLDSTPTFADVLDAAAAAATDVRLAAIHCGATNPEDENAYLDIVARPDLPDVVYLEITSTTDGRAEPSLPVVITSEAAAETAQAIRAAADYLTAVTERGDTTVTGATGEQDEPVDLAVVVAFREDTEIALFRRPHDGTPRMAVLNVELCHRLHDALEDVETTPLLRMQYVLIATDEEGYPLHLEVQGGVHQDPVIVFGDADQGPEFACLDADTAAELRDALHGALQAAAVVAAADALADGRW